MKAAETDQVQLRIKTIGNY